MPTLHLCRSASEACQGAVSAVPPGLVLVIGEEDGISFARVAVQTVLGPTDQRYTAPDRGIVDSVVRDTLRAGEADVWLAAPTGEAERLAALAVGAGFAVRRPDGAVPSALSDPFSLLRVIRRRPDPTTRGGETTVLGFCKMSLDDHLLPIEVGDELTMTVIDHSDGCDVAYVDTSGAFVGLHGRLPYPLADEARERLAEVRVAVNYTSWGRDWSAGVIVPTEMLVFDLPADVDAFLAEARLPNGRDA